VHVSQLLAFPSIWCANRENTSWALVTMASREAAEAALLAKLRSPEGTLLRLNSFSQKQADASTGAMGEVPSPRVIMITIRIIDCLIFAYVFR
jgi:hypothetical protein